MIELRVETHNAFTVCGKKTWISGQDNDLFGCFWEECHADGTVNLLRTTAKPEITNSSVSAFLAQRRILRTVPLTFMLLLKEHRFQDLILSLFQPVHGQSLRIGESSLWHLWKQRCTHLTSGFHNQVMFMPRHQNWKYIRMMEAQSSGCRLWLRNNEGDGMFYIDDMVRQHAFGMKHLQLSVALIDENHVTRRMYKEVLLIVSIGDE